MQLTREAIQRMINADSGNVGGGGGGDLSALLAGYATETWVDENYLSIEFFSKLFKAYNSANPAVEIKPNDTQSTITNIKAMFGFWTEQYLSALGQNAGGGGGGVGDVTWDALADNTDTRQIALSHLTTALSGYATQSWVNTQGYLTAITSSQIITALGYTPANNADLANYLPLTGGTMTGAITPASNQNNIDWIANTISLKTDTSNWNYTTNDKKIRLISSSSATAATGSPGLYYAGLSVISSYVGFQLVSYGGGGEDLKFRKIDDDGNWHSWNTIWNSGNDGSNSGLDADLLDGQHGSYYATASRINTIEGYFTNGSANTAVKLLNSRTIWGQSFDGSANINGSISDTGNITPSTSNTSSIGSSSLVYTSGYINELYFGDNFIKRQTHGFAALGCTSNELIICADFNELYINYRGLTGKTTITAWRWMAGNSSSYATHTIGILHAYGIINANAGINIPSGQLLKIGDAIIAWDNNNNAIKAYKLDANNQVVSVNFYTTGGVSALGYGTSGGGGGVGDVTWDALADNQDTRQIALSHLTTALSGYATQSWINTQGFLTSADINDMATKTWVTSQGYLTAITSSQIITALGYTPANNADLSNYLPLTGGTMTGAITPASNQNSIDWSANTISVKTQGGNWNFSVGDGKIRLVASTSSATGSPGLYYGGISVISSYVGFQLASYGGGGEALKFRKIDDDGNWHSWYTIWHSGNDGIDSGLDADLLDGQHGSYYATVASLSNYLPLTGGTLTGSLTVNGEITAANALHSLSIELNESGGLSGYGGFIDFHYNGTSNDYSVRLIEETANILSIDAKQVSGGTTTRAGLVVGGGQNASYIQIGNGRIVWDSTNQALRVTSADGTATNLYATGGVSALGLNTIATDGTVSANLLPSADATYNIGSSTYGWRYIHLHSLSSSIRGIISVDSDGINLSSTGGAYISGTVVKVTGRLAVGTSDDDYPSYSLGVYGNSYLEGTLYVTGNISGASITNRSDIRWKDVLADFTLNVDSVANAPLFRYRFKNGDGRVMAGTSAQYWNVVLPQTVFTDPEGMLSLDYGVTALAGVISVAREVSEHERRIAKLEAENATLRAEINDLKAA